MDSPRRLAHDLNNITIVIYGYAQRLEEAIAKTDPLQQDVQAILDEVPRLTAVVERIRSFEAPTDQEPDLLVDSERQ